MPGVDKPGTMEVMNTPVLIGIIVAAALIVLLILLVVIGKKRGEAKQVSFEKPEDQEQKELTQEQKSGNYQAKSGFSFAPGAGPQEREPVVNKQAQQPDDLAQSQQPEDSVPEKTIAEKDATAIANAQLAGEDPNSVSTPAATPAPETKEKPEEAEQADTEQENDPVNEPEKEIEDTEPKATAVENQPSDEEPRAGASTVEPEEAEEVKSEEETEQATTDEAVVEEAQEAAAAASVQAQSVQEALEKEPAEHEVSEEVEVVEAPEKAQEDIAPAGGRLGRLRGRLSRSQNAIGQGLMGILSAGDLDEDAWEEIEDTLIMADLGTKSTLKVTDSLREKIAEHGVASEEEAREMLRAALIEVGKPEIDRSIKAMPNEGKPAVVMVVGVNGTGKTTTTGKLARVLVSMSHQVLLGAADTFRAAAADQLETWGRRVGASTVRGKEGADPASVAFDAVAAGVEQGVDVVLIDTAGRLHTSVDLMDQLGKVKRVVEKKTPVDEVLLVLDATVGQNGLTQARIFRDVVDITGVVLTKLDGTAKGGIVFQVQEELGVPVKLVGLGEGADDLAPFEIESFVDALLGEK